MFSRTELRKQSTSTMLDSLQTLSQYVLEHLEITTPKELIQQKRIRNQFQRKGYPEILQSVLLKDGLSALLAYLKTRLQIEYSMPHKTFWIIAPNPPFGLEGIPFPDSWDFPADPWKQEWWMKR